MTSKYNEIFGNLEAQTFCYELKQSGFTVIDCELENDQATSASVKRKLAACEVIAAMRGHPMSKSEWSAMAEQWLEKSRKSNVPAKTQNRSIEFVESLISQPIAHDQPSIGLQDLRERLNAKPRSRPKFIPGTKKMLRETVFKLNGSDHDNPKPMIEKTGEADVTLCDLDVDASCQMIHYTNVTELTIWLPNDCVDAECEEALKILLLGWSDTLERLEFTIGESTFSKLAAAKFVVNATEQIIALKRLEHLSFDNVDIPGKMFDAICEMPKLDVLDISNSRLNRNNLSSVSKLKRMEVINFKACPNLDSERDEAYLKSLLPKARIVAVNRFGDINALAEICGWNQDNEK